MLLEENQENALHITLEPAGREELLEIIDEETDRLNNFVESMVEVARLEAGEFHLRKTSTDVEEIISHATQRTESFAANHKISVYLAEDLPKVTADSKAISEVIYNLIDNAVKYSPPKSTITVSAKQIEDCLEISVEDEGRGVSVDERNKIFQKFYRGDKTMKGFGMGLAIVRGIIEAHDGRIWVEGGKIGAKFMLELPLNVEKQND